MRIEAIRCDMCKKEHDAQYVLPPEWIQTIQNTNYGTQEEHHFCSRACLLRWARADVTANDIILEPRADHEPYRYCCAEHWPMPERSKT